MSEVYLGVFSQRRSDGHRLHDGNAAAIRISDDSPIAAIAEERIKRTKHVDGFALSASYCLEAVGWDPASDDLIIGFTSALDECWDVADVAAEIERHLAIRPKRVTVFDHHLAHAALAYDTAPIDSADSLVLVIDAAGNRLGADVQTESAYWGSRKPSGEYNLTLIERFHTNGKGFGQLWRAATKFTGFPSYHDASKLMALAGIGRGRGVEPLWDVRNDDVTNAILQQLDPDDPARGISQALRWVVNLSVEPREQGWFDASMWHAHGTSTVRKVDLSLAVAVQESYERWLTDLFFSYSPENVRLGGGVAMNCVSVGRLAARCDVHVPCAPGDDGQALGALSLLLNAEGIYGKITDCASLGVSYSGANISRNLLRQGWRRARDSVGAVAEQLQGGSIIARFHGGSEYGPRALGHRSLLAGMGIDRSRDTLERLRKIKQREDYQPFGVAIPNEALRGLVLPESPYMSFACQHQAFTQDPCISALVHDDYTLRYQGIREEEDPTFAALARSMAGSSLIPGIINTSLNLRRQPLIETADEVLSLVIDQTEIAGLWLKDEGLLLRPRGDGP